MPKTYEPIATQTLGTAVGTVTFTSIPQTYTDLKLVVSNVKHSFNNGTNPVSDGFIRFNSDSGTNYSFVGMYGTGAVVSTERTTNSTTIGAYYASSASDAALIIVDILNYSNTTTHKTSIVTERIVGGSGNANVDLRAGIYRSTSAITTLALSIGAYTYNVGSTWTLYGIKAA
jgi:hypothetical protein